ncbi:hypothetical protein CAPTEDRAFT_215924 [Capitella teleta]|uniref:Uncharacterized protein n=1 Tax=Capitella teleta TaxID=283909 RepID=R7V6W2_CAPTE|nr:hypothetical protein CAPTEDRAFT_215924 [Capitella teleta]|eukprot:ELU14304.1 hypothetical protein CAPTEDRAFT_215924 [Capitella teleta]
MEGWKSGVVSRIMYGGGALVWKVEERNRLEKKQTAFGRWLWKAHPSVRNACIQAESGWSTFSESEKAKMGYVRKIYVGGSMVAEVGRGVLLEMGLKSDWWRAVNRIAMEYNLDGVYYMLKYRRLSAEGKRLARVPDGWVEEIAKEKMERKVKQRELEKWRGKLKDTERTRRYAEERKDMRMERYADGGDGARVCMMVRGDSLLDTGHRTEWSRVWRMEKGQEDPMNGFLGVEVPPEMDCLISRSVGAIWREREKHERERE